MPTAIATAFRANRLEVFDEITTPADQATAEEALSQVLTLVRGINETLSAVPAGEFRTTEIGDNVIDRLEEWLKRLLHTLDEIVANLAKGTTFSVTVGTSISVTVNLPAVTG